MNAEKKVLIVTVVCLVLIVLAGGGAIYYYQFQELPRVKEELAQVTRQADDAQKKVDQIPGLTKEKETLQLEEKQKLRHIPNLDFKVEYDAFADLLDQLRRRSGVSVPKATWVAVTTAPVAGRKTQPQSMHRVSYDLTVNGGFYQLLRFINLLEQQTRFINVDTLTITPGSQAQDKNVKGPQTIKRDLKVTLYSFTYKLPAPKEHIIRSETREPAKSNDPPE